MKRFFAWLMACLLLLPALWAAADVVRVVDEADLLTDSQELALSQTIARIRDTYQMDVAIVIKQSIAGKDPARYAADAYEKLGCGMGEERDGLIFLLTMAERKYQTVTSGKAIRIFTDYGLDMIHDDMSAYLTDGDYYTGLSRWLRDVEKYLADYSKSGTVYDWHDGEEYAPQFQTPWERTMGYLPMVLAVGLGVALIVVFILKGQMKTVRRKPDANSYVRDGSFQLTRAQDIYLYTTTTRRKIESDNNHGNHGSHGGSGGGSSTFTSSSGNSYGGRGGSF